MFSQFRSRALCATAALVIGLSTPAFAQEAEAETPAPAPAPGNTASTFEQLKLFGDVFERVRSEYVDPVTDEKLIEYALNGMLSSLDPHSGYLNEDGFGDMQVQTRGEFGGLGIEVTMESGVVKVVTPIDDTPAYRAGMKSGDYITHIDGKPVQGLSLNEAIDKMRGPLGTEVTLTVVRAGKPFKVKLKRDTIKIRSVRARLEGDVGYVRLTQFSEQTDAGLREALSNFRKQKGDKLLGVVLDLRNNPGGLLDQAIAVSDDFLEQGEIVSTRGRNEDDASRANAKPGDLIDGLPLIVLINGGSASASEIVAGALQDHRRALIVGTQSFGKGSVQTIVQIPRHGAIRLTTARYYTPSGRSIQAKGITPDITVEPAKLETIDTSAFYDKEADLKGALANPDDKQDQSPPDAQPVDKLPDTPSDDKSVDAVKPEPDAPNPLDPKVKADGTTEATDPTSKIYDYQLARAVDLVKAINFSRASTAPKPTNGAPAKTPAPLEGDAPKDPPKTDAPAAP